MTQVFIQM